MLGVYIRKFFGYSMEDLKTKNDYDELRSNLAIMYFYCANLISRILYFIFVSYQPLKYLSFFSYASIGIIVFHYINIRKKRYKLYYRINIVEVMIYAFAVYMFTGVLAMSYCLIIYAVLLTAMAVNNKRTRLIIICVIWFLFLLLPMMPVLYEQNFSLGELFYFNIIFAVMFIIEIYVYNNINQIIESVIKENAKKNIDAINSIAYYDSLTGINNRRGFINKFDELKDTYGKEMIGKHTLAYLDIDDFKNINDTYGHDVGDEVLKKLSNIMVEYFRNTDIVARWGGEEFLVLSLNVIDYQAIKLFTALKEKVNNEKIYVNDEKYIRITLTIGIHTLIDDNYEETLKYCDEYLYYGKRNGKNKVISRVD